MNIGGFIAFMLVASVKFLVAPPVGLFAADLSLAETMVGMLIGGLMGVFAFYYSSNYFIRRSQARRRRKVESALARGEDPPRIFKAKTKQIIRLKHKLGIYGVVFILLPFVSLPVEGILCAKFFRHDRRLKPLLILSVAVWAVILSFFWYIFD